MSKELNTCLFQEPAKHLQGEACDPTRLEGFQRGDDQDQSNANHVDKEKSIIVNDFDDYFQDEEKFQREILSDEPNLIKLYLQQRGDRNSWNGTSRCDYYESNETSREDEDAFSKEAEHVKIPQQKNKVIFSPPSNQIKCML